MESTSRQRLLDAAATLFAERGFGDTSLRDIASEAGIKAASVYYHFTSMDALFAAVLQAGMDLMIDSFNGVQALGKPRDRLQAHVLGHLTVLHANLRYTSLHVTTFRTAPPEVRAQLVPQRDAYEALWTDLLHQVLPASPTAEISILRLALFGAMNSSIDWFDAEQGALDQFADVMTDAFWSGAATRSRRAA